MTENPKLEVVRKLLAKAERASTPEEAEAFAAKAEELMARYSIDAAALAASNPERVETIGTRKIMLDGYPLPKAVLLQAVAVNLNCQVLITNFKGISGRKLATIYGHESDLEAFDMLATSLLLQATTAATAVHRRAPQINGRTFRHNFLLGFAGRVRERMEAARTSAVADSAPGTALAVRDRSLAVQEHVDSEHGKVKTSKVAPTHTRSYLAGDAAGQQADLSTNARVRAGGERAEIA